MSDRFMRTETTLPSGKVARFQTDGRYLVLAIDQRVATLPEWMPAESVPAVAEAINWAASPSTSHQTGDTEQ